MKIFREKQKIVDQKIDEAKDYLEKPWKRLNKNPVFRFVHDWAKKFGLYRVTSRAAETSYYLMLALFPFMIFLISLFGLIGHSTLIHQDLLLSLEGIIPDAIYSIIDNMLTEIVGIQSITFLSFSMLGVIWASSKGFAVILRSLNHIYHTGKPLPAPLLRLLGLLFAIMLVLSIVVIMVLITFGDLLFEQLAILSGLDFLSGRLLQLGRYAASFLFLLLIFSLLYHFVSRRKARYIWSFPASAFTTIAWLIFSTAFSWYLSNFSRYTTLYGSIGGFMILMLWLYFCCIMILTGGIIHELIIDRRQMRKKDRKETVKKNAVSE